MKDIAEDTLKNPLIGGMMVQMAIGTTYNSLKNGPQLKVIGLITGLDIQEILEDKCQKAMKKFLR